MPGPRARLAVIALAAAYACFIAWYHAPYATGADAAGYMSFAKMILNGELHAPVQMPPGMPEDLLPRESFVPPGFRLDASRNHMVPTYPVGLPLHLAAIGWLTGLPLASTALAILSALAFAGLLYLTCRDFGVNPAPSATVAVLAALSPLTLFFAMVVMSDLLSAVWVLAMIYLARLARRGLLPAAAAGAALSIAVLIRPTNLLMVVPALFALPTNIRTWSAFAAGGIPGALFLLWLNHALYGAYVATGYGDMSSFFSFAYFPKTFVHYAVWLPVLASPLAGAAALLPWVGIGRRVKFTLAAWAGVLPLFYAAYYFTSLDWWWLRFVLPSLPALGIAAALVLQHLRVPAWCPTLLGWLDPSAPNGTGRVRLWLTACVLVVFTPWMVAWTVELNVLKFKRNDLSYPLTGEWVARELPANAVLLAYQVSGALQYYTTRPFVLPALLQPGDCARLETWLGRNPRPLYAAIHSHEKAEILRKFPGRWEIVQKIKQATILRRID